jgi:hypothetical protein
MCCGAGFTVSFIRAESYILASLWSLIYFVFCTHVEVEEEEGGRQRHNPLMTTAAN